MKKKALAKKSKAAARKQPKRIPSRKPREKTLSPQVALPKPHKNAEIIVRQGFLIDATGKGPHAVPEVVLLANAEALRYLAEVFGHLANVAKSRRPADSECVVGLPRDDHPINVRLSDDLDFRFALLTEDNRRQMFKKFGIDMASKQKGSLFERYQEVVAHFGRLQNLMRREGLVDSKPQ